MPADGSRRRARARVVLNSWRKALTHERAHMQKMTRTSLGRTQLSVFPLCLGGNVFGWTADEVQSHEVLDAYVSAGGNFIDTANSYLTEHGLSEAIIGSWLAGRDDRDEIVLATKVGAARGRCAT